MTVVENIKNATAMKIMGWFLIVLSVVEFGIGGAVYGFLTNVHLGAWWGAICCFIAGVCGAMSNSRAVVITGLVFSIFAIIISIVGAIVDGLASAVFAAETGCVNTEKYKAWGTDEGKLDAAWCAFGSYFGYGYNFYNSNGQEGTAAKAMSAAKGAVGKGTEAFYNLYYNRPYNNNNNNFFYNHPGWVFYYNINHFYYNWYQTHNTYYWNSNHGGNNNNYNNNNYNNNYNYNYNYNNFYLISEISNQCVCSDGTLCYGYDLASGDNCGEILTTYTSLLSASTAFLAILVVLSFVYSILTCIACSGSSAVTTVPVAVAPMQVQMAPVAAAPGYVQPGMAPVGYAAVPQPMGYAPVPVGYAPAPQPMMMQPQQQPVMYAAQPAVATAAPVGYAPVVQAGDTKFV